MVVIMIIIVISRWIPSDYQARVLATLPQILFLNSGFRDRDKDKQAAPNQCQSTILLNIGK